MSYRTDDFSILAWMLFTAATVLDDSVRDQLIQFAWNRAVLNASPGELPDMYNVVTGDISDYRGGRAGQVIICPVRSLVLRHLIFKSPALGAIFAPLALT